MERQVIRYAVASALSVMMAGVVFAQGPPPSTSPEQGQAATQITRAMDGQTVTAVGCLMQEKDVPGQQPNPVERVGVGRDYVLTNVRLTPGATGAGTGATGATGATGTAGTTGTGTTGTGTTTGTATTGTGATGTAGTQPGAATAARGSAGMSGQSGAMRVRVVGLDAQVQQNVGKQVEVSGRLEVDEEDVRGRTGAGAATGAAGAGTGTSPATGTGTGAGTTGAAGTGAGSTAGAPRGGMMGDQPLPELHATNIRVVGQSCSGQQQ